LNITFEEGSNLKPMVSKDPMRWSKVLVGHQIILKNLAVYQGIGYYNWQFSLPILIGQNIAGRFELGPGESEGLNLK
jgi:hypothetical protein